MSSFLWEFVSFLKTCLFLCSEPGLRRTHDKIGYCRWFEIVAPGVVCTAFDSLQFWLFKGSIHIRTCFRCRLPKYYTLAEICRNGNEESPGQPCPKYLGPGHNNSASSQPVLVSFWSARAAFCRLGKCCIFVFLFYLRCCCHIHLIYILLFL